MSQECILSSVLIPIYDKDRNGLCLILLRSELYFCEALIIQIVLSYNAHVSNLIVLHYLKNFIVCPPHSFHLLS
ncbi:1263_t:CDS:2 [Funneliformis mosseae]|uniref:1263_t:CDS:1 n=1 Tax=Funneliformis mosseae TaxID=27381 RepID=A0A9N8ZNU9_FUNMO|nr:1263_t:CDS:2 [Funneliformis mosseae]